MKRLVWTNLVLGIWLIAGLVLLALGVRIPRGAARRAESSAMPDLATHGAHR